MCVHTCINFTPLSPSNLSGETAAYIINKRNLFSGEVSYKIGELLHYVTDNKADTSLSERISQFDVYLTWYVLKKLITSFAPASPKTRSCSNCPRSRSPRSLMHVLIFPAICSDTRFGLGSKTHNHSNGKHQKEF